MSNLHRVLFYPGSNKGVRRRAYHHNGPLQWGWGGGGGLDRQLQLGHHTPEAGQLAYLLGHTRVCPGDKLAV